MPSKMLLCMKELPDSSRIGAVLVIVAAVHRLCVMVIGGLIDDDAQRGIGVCIWKCRDRTPGFRLVRAGRPRRFTSSSVRNRYTLFLHAFARCTNAQMLGRNLGTV